MSDPSPTELLRRIEDLAKAMERIAATLEQSYVRKDVYDAQRAGDITSAKADVKDVADDVRDLKAKAEKADTFRRQIIAGAAIGVIAQLTQLFIALNVVKGG